MSMNVRSGKRFEVFQKITLKPLKSCPTCGGAFKRMIGTGAAVLPKGPGFYATDYRSESYKEAQKREEEVK